MSAEAISRSVPTSPVARMLRPYRSIGRQRSIKVLVLFGVIDDTADRFLGVVSMPAPVLDLITMPRPGVSNDMADVLTESIVVEHDPESAEDWGAFEDAALSESEASLANADLSVSEAQAR